MKYLGFLYGLFIVLGCSSNKEDSAIYFGGKIINPKERHVVLLKNEEVIDTLFLDENNRFLKKFENLKEDLYTFKHGIEFQYIYFQPKDSIFVHLNTWDFDESLVFSGKGSYKNEFLLDLFLEDEQILPKINPYFSEEEAQFETQIEKILEERLKLYNEFLKNEEILSEKYKKIAFVAIHYPVYRLKEVYPLYYYNIHHKFPEISKSYYEFRQKIDFNIPFLFNFYSYYNYAVGYAYNVGYLNSKSQPETPLIIHFLNTVTDNISSEKLRNDLLYRFTITDMFDSKDYSSNQKTLDLFFEHCTDKKYIEQMQKLISDCKKIPLNEKMANFSVKNYKNQSFTIKNITQNKNTVIYFWSTHNTTAQFLVNRLHFLENRFPNVLFVGINTDTKFDIYTSDKGYLKLSLKKQYKLSENSEAFSFLTSDFPKALMIDKQGKIIHRFLSLNSTNLNHDLQVFKK